MRRTQSSDQVGAIPFNETVGKIPEGQETISFPPPPIVMNETKNSPTFGQNHFRFRERRGSSSRERKGSFSPSSSIDEGNSGEFDHNVEADSVGLPLDIDDADYEYHDRNSIDSSDDKSTISLNRTSIFRMACWLDSIGLDGEKLAPPLTGLCLSNHVSLNIQGLAKLSLSSSLRTLLNHCSIQELCILAENLPTTEEKAVEANMTTCVKIRQESTPSPHTSLSQSGLVSSNNPPSSNRERSWSAPAYEPGLSLSKVNMGWLGSARSRARATLKAAADGIHQAALVAVEVAAAEAHDFTHGGRVAQYDMDGQGDVHNFGNKVVNKNQTQVRGVGVDVTMTEPMGMKHTDSFEIQTNNSNKANNYPLDVTHVEMNRTPSDLERGRDDVCSPPLTPSAEKKNSGGNETGRDWLSHLNFLTD